MKQTKLIMGMPITVEIVGATNAAALLSDTFTYFSQIDDRYSTYKASSEISRINSGLTRESWSIEMQSIFKLCEQTKQDTDGFFDIVRPDGKYDPSGLVKGWAIAEAAHHLRNCGVNHFYIDGGGDIQTQGLNSHKKRWTIGIRNPFNHSEIVKTLAISSEGVATSGTSVRGQHIYNPFDRSKALDKIKSITVIGPDIYDADRFATTAFAMGKKGIEFIQSLPGFEAYMIDNNKIATYTAGFERYVV